MLPNDVCRCAGRIATPENMNGPMRRALSLLGRVAMPGDFAPEHVWRASMAIKPYCVNCGCTDGPSELLYTGDEDSLDGWEIWFSCDKCRNAWLPHETFFKIEAEVEESSDAGG